MKVLNYEHGMNGQDSIFILSNQIMFSFSLILFSTDEFDNKHMVVLMIFVSEYYNIHTSI